MTLTDTHALTHTFTFVSQSPVLRNIFNIHNTYEIFFPLTDAEVVLSRVQHHGTAVNNPSRRIYSVYPEGWRGFQRSPVSPSIYVGMWVYSQRSVSVLCYSMCLRLWGGAPWTVNIGQAGEGRSLLCAWHGPVSVSDSLPAESTATIPLRLTPSLLLSSSPLFSSVFFSLHVLLQSYDLEQPAVKYASVSGWDLCKSSFSDSWFFYYFFFFICQFKSEDYTAVMGCECSVFLWIRKYLRKHSWVKWKKKKKWNQTDLGTLQHIRGGKQTHILYSSRGSDA